MEKICVQHRWAFQSHMQPVNNMNKKGVFGLTLFFAILLIIVIGSIVLFIGVFKSSPVNYTYKSAAENAVVQSFLLAYMRTPAENSNMATLIAQWARTGDKEQQLMQNTNKIITDLYKKNGCWTLTAGERKLSNANCEESKDPKTSSITIPLSSGEPVEVTFTQ